MPEPTDHERGREQPSDDKAAERLRQFEQERGLAPTEGEEQTQQEDPQPKAQRRRSKQTEPDQAQPSRHCDDEEAE
jgi:hypothetical protein